MNLPKGEEVVVQEGVLGTKLVDCVKSYEDDLYIEEKILDETVSVEPIPKIIDVGTSEILAKLQVHIGDIIYVNKNVNLKRNFGFSYGFKNLKVNLIFCMMRHFPFEKNLEIIKLAKKYLGNGCCAIDLAGGEAQFKTSEFEELFKIAREENIPFTIHAGEADGADSLMSAISFGTKRIGHGVRCIEDENVVNLIRDKGIYLEVCPTSNIDTKTFNSMKEHSIKELVDKNILVTISTDNRTVSNTNLKHEYEVLSDTFGFNEDDFLKFNLNAIDAAFISEEEKEELRRRLVE